MINSIKFKYNSRYGKRNTETEKMKKQPIILKY